MPGMTPEERRLRQERIAATKREKEERARIREEKRVAKVNANRPKTVLAFIHKYKYLQRKYWKTNVWCVAHRDSQSSRYFSCSCCGEVGQQYSLSNTRKTDGGKNMYTWGNEKHIGIWKAVCFKGICWRCYDEVMKQIGATSNEFKMDYAK